MSRVARTMPDRRPQDLGSSTGGTVHIALLVDAATARVLGGSRSAVTAFGYEPEELTKLEIDRLVAPDARGDFAAAISLGDAEERPLATQMIHRNGATFPLRGTAQRVTLGSQHVTLLTFYDDRKPISEGTTANGQHAVDAETFVAGSEGGVRPDHGRDGDASPQREPVVSTEVEPAHHSVSDHVPDSMIYQIDVSADGKTRRFTYVSGGVEQLHEVSAEAALEDPQVLYAQIVESDLSHLTALESRAMATLSPFQAEVRFRLPSGAVRWRSLASAPRRASNGNVIWNGIEIDITARRQAESAYRVLVETSLQGLVIIQNDRIVFANPAAERMSGYSARELRELPAPIQTLVHPEDLPEIVQRRERRARGEPVAPFAVYRIVQKNGQLRWVESVTTPIEFRGAPAQHTVYIDVTDRLRAEAEIRLLKRSIDLHPDGVFWLDEQGQFVYVNETGAQTLGYEPRDLVGRHISLVNPAATPDRMKVVWTRLRSDGLLCTESRHRRRNGTEFPVEVSTMLVELDGRVYACGFATDITGRRASQETLRKISAAIEQAPSTVVITDASGAIEYVNPKFAQLTGYDLEEIRGTNPRVLRSGTTSATEYRTLWHKITRGEEWHGEFDTTRFPTIQIDAE